MKKKTTCIIITTIILFISFTHTICAEQSASALYLPHFDESSYLPPEGPDVNGVSAILMETERAQVLYSKRPEERLHISAANKLMTCFIALENCSELDVNVTISKESVEAEGSALNLEAGEKYTLEELLYAVMLTSANDAARAIAEYVGGDINKFIDMMNNKAVELNLHNTHFVNPTGLFDESQYTTAYDTALLVRHAINTNPNFNRLFSTQLKPWTRKNGESTVLTSQNDLFWSYDGVDGGKTGYNYQEQQTVITTATRGAQRFVCIVLDSPVDSMFEDSVNILDFGFSNFRKGLLVKKNDPLRTITVEGNELHLISMFDIYYTHPIGESYIETAKFSVADNIELPIVSDEIIGTAKYVLKDNTVIEVKLYPDREIKLPEDFYDSLKKKFLQNKDILILAGLLLAIEVLIILYHILKLVSKLVKKIFITSNR